MRKFVVKLSLAKLDVPAKIALGDHIVDSITGNAAFATPSPTLAAAQTATDDLRQAYDDSLGGSDLSKAVLAAAEEAFDQLFTAMGHYVDNVAQGDQAIIVSAGMETRRINTPVGPMPQVTNLKVVGGALSGSVRLRWKGIYGRLIYHVYMKADGQTDDQYALVSSNGRVETIVSGLEPGALYWFKVEAVGSAGVGPASTAAAVHATW